MKKILSVLFATAMSAMLLTGCMATTQAAKPDPPPVVVQTHELEIVNKTINFRIEIACMAKIVNGRPEDKCIFDPIMIEPGTSAKVCLPAGFRYAVLVIGTDIRTNKQSISVMASPIIDKDGELVFQEQRGMNVGGETLDV